MKIDGETVVPIGWVLSGAATIVAVSIACTFWVATVNERLARIEDKLGITPYKLSPFENTAHAEHVKKK